MALINKTFKNTNHGFTVKVTGAGKKLVTAWIEEKQESVKFARSKFQWMVSKGIFEEVTN